jgi:hypothetical protein
MVSAFAFRRYEGKHCGLCGQVTISYDIYCLMLLRCCSRLLDRCNSLLNPRDYCRNNCNCLKITRLPFRSNGLSLHAEAVGQDSENQFDLDRYRSRFSASLDPMRGATAINGCRLTFLAFPDGFGRAATKDGTTNGPSLESSLSKPLYGMHPVSGNVLFRMISHVSYCDNVSFE